jgi:hypothetical protein
VIDIVKYRKIHEEVMKKLDKLENEFLPQVTVDNTEVILDTVRYLEPQKKELIIANTGQVLYYCTCTLKINYFSSRFQCSLNLSKNLMTAAFAKSG